MQLNSHLCSGRIFAAVVACVFCWLEVPAGLTAQVTEPDQIHSKTMFWPYVGDLSGVVVDSDANPVAGATVYVGNFMRSSDNGRKRITVTDEKGKFNFVNQLLQRMTYVTAVHPEFAIHGIVVDSDSLRIELNSGVTINGRIVDHLDKPIDGVYVALRRSFGVKDLGYEHSRTHTDQDGRFSIEHAPAGARVNLELNKRGIVKTTLAFLAKGTETPEQPFVAPGIVRLNQEIYVRNDFTYKLPQAAQLKISAADESTERNLSNAKAYSIRFPRAGSDDKIPKNARQGNLDSEFVFSDVESGSNRFWIQPPDDSGLLGAVFDVLVKPKTTTLEQTVHLKPGIRVEGRVLAEESGDPIENVVIEYRPNNSARLIEGNIYCDRSVKTDEHGEFELLVPAGPAKLRMVGEVRGYVTLSEKHLDELPTEIANRFVRVINPTIDEPQSQLEFRLRAAPVVAGTVLDAAGKPAANIAFVATHYRIGKSKSLVNGVTDESGRFELDSLYDDATFAYDQLPDRYKRQLKRGRDVPNQEKLIEFNRIYFWDPVSFQNVKLTVKLNEVQTENGTFDVQLESPAVIHGQVLLEGSAKPITGADINVSLVYSSPMSRGFRWSAVTDEYGKFTVGKLFADEEIELTVMAEDHVGDRQSVVVGKATEPIETGSITLAEAIVPKQLEVIDVTKFSDKKALDELVGYIRKQIEDAPSGRADGPSPDDKKWTFRQTLTRKIDVQLTTLLARKPDPEFQCRVYIEVLDAISENQTTKLPNVAWTGKARFELIKHIDLEGVFDKYQKYDWIISSMMYSMQILKHSKKHKIREWAYLRLLQESVFNLKYNCSSNSYVSSNFDSTLKQTEKILMQGVEEFGNSEMPGAPVQKLKDYIPDRVRKIVSDATDDAKYDQARVKKVSEMIARLKPRPKT